MKYLYDKWNEKCLCNWTYTDPSIVTENWEPVEGTVTIDLNPNCPKHDVVYKWVTAKTVYTKISLTLLKELELKDKNETLFMNRLGLIFKNEV